MRPNTLRQMLDAGKPTFGTHMCVPWPGMVEIIANAGVFDYIEYVGEYSVFTAESLENIGRAIDLYPNLSAMMKVEDPHRAFITQRSIDAGIQNVLFTDIRTPEDAHAAIRIVRAETPEAKGTHGAGMRRNVGYVMGGGSPDWCKAMDDVVIALMIEKKSAMDHLDELLDIPGVDMLQFGPTDYSVSVGKPGQGRADDVQAAQLLMVKKALAKGKHPRIELGSLEQAKPWLDMGVRHFCVGWDITTVFGWCKGQGKILEELGFRTAGVEGPQTGYAAAQR